jgi:hypothetical protein
MNHKARAVRLREHLPHWNRRERSLDAAYQDALGGTHPPPPPHRLGQKPDLLRQQTSKPQVRNLLGVVFCGRKCCCRFITCDECVNCGALSACRDGFSEREI